MSKATAVLSGALAIGMLVKPSRANAAEPLKPASPTGPIAATGNAPGGQVPGQEKPKLSDPVRYGAGFLTTGLGGAALLIGGSKVRDKLNSSGLPATRLQRVANVGKGGALITAGAALLGVGIPLLSKDQSKPASQPAGPAGPIGATGNAPGGQVPGQSEGPGALTKAAVTLATALPQTAPIVQAAKDPETALRLGVGVAGTAATVQAARMLSPAARVGAKFLTKAMLPLTAALAAIDTVKGYEKDGVKGAALGLADSLTGGLVNLGLEKAGLMQPVATTPPITPQAVVSDRLDVARAAAERTTGEMGQTQVLNQGSTRPAAAETSSDGMTDDYFRQQNGRQVRVSGYATPGR